MSTLQKNEKNTPDSPAIRKPRGSRLARRARSFKEDFLEILSQMRSPSGTGTRSGSPCSPKTRSGKQPAELTDGPPSSPGGTNPAKDLEVYVHQAQLALKHFRDVVSKNKLEMLPGNGTVVLETVTAIHVLLKKYVLNDQSSALVSATNQVYQSLAKLIKLCDDYLLIGDKALTKEVVTEVVILVEHAIQNLVSLTRDKLEHKGSSHHKPRTLSDRTSLEVCQRSSLPDIPLTPREREILEQTSAFVLERHSQSTENILRDSPPPKPPHPDRVKMESPFPPPLPPKKRLRNVDDTATVRASSDCLSFHSKSPEDSSSLLSASAGSLDSVLNHSRGEEEEELGGREDMMLSQLHLNGSSQSCCWDSSSSTSTEQPTRVKTSALSDSRGSPVFVQDITSCVLDSSTTKLERLSGSQAESGFSSMPSRRSSSQSYSACSQQFSSARSSQQSYTSQMVSCETSTRVHSSTVTMHTHSVSSEKLSLMEKQSLVVQGICGCEPSDETFCPIHGSSSPSLKDCRLHGTPNGSLRGSPKQLSPVHGQDTPPALPEKTRTRSRRERHASHYDNVSDSEKMMETTQRHCLVVDGEMVEQQSRAVSRTSALHCAMSLDSHQAVIQANSSDMSVSHSRTCSGVTQHNLHNILESSLNISSPDGKPPPLPIKKKHIMAYMEMFGNASHGNTNEFLRHTVHAYSLQQADCHQQEVMLSTTQSCSFNLSSHSNQATPTRSLPKPHKEGLPPALPPKKSRTRSVTTSPPSTPVLAPLAVNGKAEPLEKAVEPPKSPKPLSSTSAGSLEAEHPPISPKQPILRDVENGVEEVGEPSLLDRLEISQYLVLKNPDDDGYEIRGGLPDALVIRATKVHKNDFLYQEAFLTTYRTFLSPLELIQKLCYRHDKFINSRDSSKQRAAREAFSLLVRAASDLTLTDLDQVVLQTLMEFVQQLLCRGELTMAKALRGIILNKHAAKKLFVSSSSVLLPSHNVITRQSSLLDFKSEQIAEQMTLLDAELFLKIEIPEVLIWAQEQNEERSPNLTRFTEHFNKMSYWARSRILEQNDGKDREKYVVKFIKIMKYLRKMNNFNSYLALLSALDSAPIRRLEWQKHITEGLKEYCALIDSSSSFRAYRQALAETQPPCIPYIGLVLQDLTFVHIGNSNLLPDGGINFSKRWQQFNIVENMKRFKAGTYPFKKNERIIAFFNSFDESLSEEAMWQISEKIKPRGGRKV